MKISWVKLCEGSGALVAPDFGGVCNWCNSTVSATEAGVVDLTEDWGCAPDCAKIDDYFEPINDFRGAYRWLSNFHEAEVEYEGDIYPSTEHAYQAAKTLDPEERALIRSQPKPSHAKRLGMQTTLRPSWDEMKAQVMLELTHQKYTKHPYLKAALLATGETELIEGNTWHDNFFGTCVCDKCGNEGLNVLGKILMIVREELRCEG